MKQTKITATLTAAFALAQFTSFAQTEKKSAGATAHSEYKTPLGTFTLESATPVNKEEIQYTQTVTTTSDGGTATYLVNNEAAQRQVEAAAVASTEEQVTIYPNPSEGKIQVISPPQAGSVIGIEIYNLLGEVIYQSASINPQSAIDLSGQSKGMYFYKVTDENGTSSAGKLILSQPYE